MAAEGELPALLQVCPRSPWRRGRPAVSRTSRRGSFDRASRGPLGGRPFPGLRPTRRDRGSGTRAGRHRRRLRAAACDRRSSRSPLHLLEHLDFEERSAGPAMRRPRGSRASIAAASFRVGLGRLDRPLVPHNGTYQRNISCPPARPYPQGAVIWISSSPTKSPKESAGLFPCLCATCRARGALGSAQHGAGSRPRLGGHGSGAAGRVGGPVADLDRAQRRHRPSLLPERGADPRVAAARSPSTATDTRSARRASRSGCSVRTAPASSSSRTSRSRAAATTAPAPRSRPGEKS